MDNLSKIALKEKILAGEDNYLELKDVYFEDGKIRGPLQKDLADEIASFANSEGGIIVLGVDDTSREIRGIPLEYMDRVESVVIQASRDTIDPPCRTIITRECLENSKGDKCYVIVVKVDRSREVHRSEKDFYYRLGSTKRVMSKHLLAEILRERSRVSSHNYDGIAVSKSTFHDLDNLLWKRFFGPLSDASSPKTYLEKLGMLVKEDSTWRPTVAGVLLGCEHPQDFLPHAYIQAVAYRGLSVVPAGGRAYQNDAQDICGTLDQQINQAFQFVKKNMKVTARKSPMGGRIDHPQYDMVAIFEALTNAVAHRDYSKYGAHIRLRMFDDRLELYCPGALANSLTTEKMAFIQESRNPVITSLLARIPIIQEEVAYYRKMMMDKRGEGVPAILLRSKDISGKTPTYEMPTPSLLILTIYAADIE